MLENTGLTCVARAYGGSALGLTLSQLHAADIWARADIPHGAFNQSHQAIALGGARVLVLDHDAPDAVALLAANPPFQSASLRGWRMIACLLILYFSAAPCSPSAVFVQRRAEGAVTQSR